MKFSCTQENLYQGLAITSRVGQKQVNLPILENVLIQVTEGGIKLVATNLELAITCQIRGKIDQEGEYTVPSKLFNDFIALQPPERIDIDLLDDSLYITSANTKTRIKGMPANEFPLIPPIQNGVQYSFSVSELRQVLAKTLFAAATNESRPELAGVFFSFRDERTGADTCLVAATDSYRLSEVITSPSSGSEEAKTVIVPQRALSELNRILGLFKDDLEAPVTVDLIVAADQIAFRFGSVEIVSRVIAGSYPDYRQIIPTTHKTRAEIGRNELMQALKAASLFSQQGIYDVKMNVDAANQQVEISSASGARGENKIQLAAAITGDSCQVKLNYRYLLDGLQVIEGGKILLDLIDGAHPCVLRAVTELPKEDFRYIVMPIRQ